MKKIILIVTLLIAGFSSYCQEIPKWKITDVEKLMVSRDSTILILNFWATFCKPCVAEIPSFIKVAEKYKSQNVKLVLVSLDLPSYYPDKISAFAQKNKFNTNISWLAETNADYFCPKIDKTWSGSIPATLILNTVTGQKRFFEGEIKDTELEKAIKVVTGE